MLKQLAHSKGRKIQFKINFQLTIKSKQIDFVGLFENQQNIKTGFEKYRKLFSFWISLSFVYWNEGTRNV